MGCLYSKNCYTAMQVHFALFLEMNCIKSYELYVPLSTIEAAFAYYLKKNGLKYNKIYYYIEKLCIDEGFDLSPGRKHIDTRCVVGVSVQRFQKV